MHRKEILKNNFLLEIKKFKAEHKIKKLKDLFSKRNNETILLREKFFANYVISSYPRS